MSTLSWKSEWKYLLWVLCATLWIALTAVLPDFVDNPITGIRGIITITIYVLAISVMSFLVFYLVGLNKYVAAVCVPLYGIIGSAVSYYRVMYRVTITPLMVDCILHTNAEEALGVITWQLVLWIIFNVLVAIGLVIWRWKQEKNLSYSSLRLIACILLLFIYPKLNSRLHQSLNQRYPMNIVESVCQYYHLQQLRKSERSVPEYAVMQEPIDSLDIIVVIGESLRPDHLQLNGYPRETNPMLSKRRNVISFPNVYSQYTHTAVSVPVLMTRADSIHPEYQYNETSFIAILRQQGYHTAWISNQDMGESYAFAPLECDTAIFVNAGKSTYVFSGWYDEELWKPLNEQLALNHTHNLLVLHTIGSHWYYNNHVPEEHYHFQPITDNRVVTYNTQEQVINSYDNTARYMDYVLDSIIRCVEHKCAVVIYLSDHGESLGENGHFLHASGEYEQTLCACVVWYSTRFEELYPWKVENLRSNSSHHYYTDFLFHTVLSAANISMIEGIEPKESLFD